jgi:hypothetical protein
VTVRGVRWLALIAFIASFIALRPSAPASAGVKGRVFTVAGNGDEWSSPWGVATEARVVPAAISVGPRGDLVILELGGRVLRVDRDGLLSTIDTVSTGPVSASDVSVGPSGEVYVASASLLRLVPAGAPSLLARPPLPTAPFERVSAEAGGAVLVTSGSHGVFRWEPGGSVSAVAAPTSGAGTNGDGRPVVPGVAALADIAAAPDGSILISDLDGRVARISSDGGYRPLGGRAPTSAEGSSWALGVKRNGNVLLTTRAHLVEIDGDGHRRMLAGTRAPRALTAAGDGLPALQVPLHASDVAVGTDGSIFFVDGTRVRFIAPRRPQRLAAALLVLDGRATTSEYRARYAMTRHGEASLTLWQVTPDDWTVIAERSGRARSSAANRLTLPVPQHPGLYNVELQVNTASNQTADQAITLFLGGRLPLPWARAIADPRFFGKRIVAGSADEDATEWRLRSCTAVTSSRADCQLDSRPDDTVGFSCHHMSSVQLRQTGELVTRRYSCPKRSGSPVRIRPHWTTTPQLVDLEAIARSTSWPRGLS